MAKGDVRPLFSTKDINRWFDIFEDRSEDKMLKTLQYAGEYFVKLARSSGRYDDITGNLRSSIGYIILRDGKIVDENFELSKKGTDKAKGRNEAVALAKKIATTNKKGLVLIGLAGMQYATYVEAMDGKDVISGAYISTEDFLRKLIEKAFKKAKIYGR